MNLEGLIRRGFFNSKPKELSKEHQFQLLIEHAKYWGTQADYFISANSPQYLIEDAQKRRLVALIEAENILSKK